MKDNEEYQNDVKSLDAKMAEYELKNGCGASTNELQTAYQDHFAKWFKAVCARHWKKMHVAAIVIVHDVNDMVAREYQRLANKWK